MTPKGLADRIIIASVDEGVIGVAVARYRGGEAGEISEILGIGGVGHVVGCVAGINGFDLSLYI